MPPIQKIFGRLGNDMFQKAFCYAYARKHNLDHYFQDPKFFKGYEEEVKLIFRDGVRDLDMVAIHVRRGDYVNNPFYVDLSQTSYYYDAMAQFPQERFLVFSDDIPWCKQQGIFQNCEFSEGRTEQEDLTLMASCKGVICANSSFSWWGGYLSKGKVVAPRAWYSDGVERTKCPKNWIRL